MFNYQWLVLGLHTDATYIYIYIYIYLYICVCVYINIYVNIYVCVCAFICLFLRVCYKNGSGRRRKIVEGWCGWNQYITFAPGSRCLKMGPWITFNCEIWTVDLEHGQNDPILWQNMWQNYAKFIFHFCGWLSVVLWGRYGAPFACQPRATRTVKKLFGNMLPYGLTTVPLTRGCGQSCICECIWFCEPTSLNVPPLLFSN
jgi:hypothetical protein